MGAERPLDLHAVDDLRTGPPLGRSENDRRPQRLRVNAVRPRVCLDFSDLVVASVERRRESAVHPHGIVTLDEVHVVTMPAKEATDRVVARPREHGGAGNLVAVQMKDREYGAIARRIEEAHAFPGALERPRFCLTVSNDSGHDQIRIVEGRTERVRQDVTKLAAFVDRSRRRRADMAWDSVRRGELTKETTHSVGVFGDLRIDLRVGALEVHVRDHRRPAVTGAGEKNYVRVALSDQAIQMHVDEAQTWRRSPVPEEPRLHVRGREGLAKERVRQEIDLPDGQVICSTPVSVEGFELTRADRFGHGRCWMMRYHRRGRERPRRARTR